MGFATIMTCFAIGLSLMTVLPVSMPAAADGGSAATFRVTPPQPLMDDQLHIAISGLPPNASVTLRAASRAHDQRWWRSTAIFRSRPDGTIDLGAQAPEAGSYRGADAMGLFWSMQPDASQKQGSDSFFTISDWFAPVITEIEASIENRAAGSVRIERRTARPGIRCVDIDDAGIIGFLCEPGDRRPHRGVIVLGGSEGGCPRSDAAHFASRGFTALALAYFGAKGVPATLQNIPVEYFFTAVRWMRARREVDRGPVALFGASRGAEAALMIAALSPEVSAVVAVAPSHARWEGINDKRRPAGPAWTYGGSPLPYIPNRIGVRFAARYVWDSVAGNPIPTAPLFLENLAEYRGTADVEIPVEKIQGPVLLLSGQDDQVWPSALMAERVMARLRRNRHAYRDEHLSYDHSGHWLPDGYVPTGGARQRMRWAIGGTPEGTARAHADAWPKILRLLSGEPGEQTSGR